MVTSPYDKTLETGFATVSRVFATLITNDPQGKTLPSYEGKECHGTGICAKWCRNYCGKSKSFVGPGVAQPLVVAGGRFHENLLISSGSQQLGSDVEL